MNIKYHKWLELEVTHNYFPDGICSILNIIPTQNSIRIFENYQILLKKHANTVAFYIGLNDEESLDVSKHFEGISNLYFQVLLEDNLFFNYTDIDFPNEDQTFIFSNKNKDNSALQLSEFTSASDLVSIRKETFNINLEEGNTQLEVKNSSGLVVINKNISNTTASNYSINLSSEENGMYELFLNSESHGQFFKCTEQLDANCIGIIQLNIETLRHTYENGMKYHIDFYAQTVYRKYKIAVPDTRKMEITTMEIQGMENEKYTGPIEEKLMGNQMVSVFTSNIPLQVKLQLEKHPQLNIAYTSEFSNRASDLELKLPNPSTENINTNTNEENEVSFYSSTIIHV
ncbi:MAG: hypothetical protein JKY22_02735 [Flavobacteriaceae bacterium]|nr:hypothetical protein [Flavobacteriaceae bacterium]